MLQEQHKCQCSMSVCVVPAECRGVSVPVAALPELAEQPTSLTACRPRIRCIGSYNAVQIIVAIVGVRAGDISPPWTTYGGGGAGSGEDARRGWRRGGSAQR